MEGKKIEKGGRYTDGPTKPLKGDEKFTADSDMELYLQGKIP